MWLLRWLGQVLLWSLEVLIILMWLPVYALVRPVELAHQWAFRSVSWYRRWLRQQRISNLRVGQEIETWAAPDMRKDFLIVDLSRLNEDLVGVKTRTYGVYRRTAPVPAYPDETEYLSIWNVP